MQVRSLIATAFAVATLAAGGTAFAQTSLYGQEGGQVEAFVPTKSRAQVEQERVQFNAEYPVSPWSFRYDPLTKFKSTATRAEVTAAYLADREEATALLGEDSGSAYLAQNSNRSVPAGNNLASTGNAAQVR